MSDPSPLTGPLTPAMHRFLFQRQQNLVEEETKYTYKTVGQEKHEVKMRQALSNPSTHHKIVKGNSTSIYNFPRFLSAG